MIHGAVGNWATNRHYSNSSALLSSLRFFGYFGFLFCILLPSFYCLYPKSPESLFAAEMKDIVIYSPGLFCRHLNQNTPLYIFNAGIPYTSSSWIPFILENSKKISNFCLFTRSGYKFGASNDLLTLIELISVPNPKIYVGHSGAGFEYFLLKTKEFPFSNPFEFYILVDPVLPFVTNEWIQDAKDSIQIARSIGNFNTVIVPLLSFLDYPGYLPSSLKPFARFQFPLNWYLRLLEYSTVSNIGYLSTAARETEFLVDSLVQLNESFPPTASSVLHTPLRICLARESEIYQQIKEFLPFLQKSTFLSEISDSHFFYIKDSFCILKPFD